MKFGFVVPWGDATDVARLAVAAEANGWDGVFTWEPVWGVDAWISLALAADRTTTIRLGTMLTPLPRRKPWELAGQVATVDRASNGRAILGVGLGAPDTGYSSFGEITDRRTRAELLDESLDIVRGLWKGQPFDYTGKHYTLTPTEFPTIGHTVQKPGVPIWCVGVLHAPKSMRRALSCEGLMPQVIADGAARQCTLEELQATDLPVGLDVIIEGCWGEHSPAAWRDAGATWWIESMWGAVSDPEPVGAALTRLEAGPPAVD